MQVPRILARPFSEVCDRPGEGRSPGFFASHSFSCAATRGYMATGARLWCPYFLGLCAEQLGKAGRAEEGMDAIARSLAIAEKSWEWYAMPVLYRIKDELIVQTGHGTRAKGLAC